MVRPEPSRLPIGGDRLLLAPQPPEGHAQVEVRVGVPGLELDGAPEVGERRFAPPELGKDVAEIAPGLRVIRVDLQGLGYQIFGFGHAPLLGPQHPQQVQGVELAGGLDQNLAIEPVSRRPIAPVVGTDRRLQQMGRGLRHAFAVLLLARQNASGEAPMQNRLAAGVF